MSLAKNISPSELERLRRARWLGRTNLLWLCNNVLGYRDINEEVHQPVLDLLQKFPLPPKEIAVQLDKVQPGYISYQPWKNPYELPGKRRVLILDPRAHLKTSINCVSHTIQWILNYPHLGYLIIQSNSQKAEDILREIKYHFQYNTALREIYPDYCPQRRISDWGNRQEFDVPDAEGRARIIEEYAKYDLESIKGRKEHTGMTASIDKGTAGYHWDVMKFSDIVEDNNTRTVDQIQAVIRTFNLMENLLTRPAAWIDVEGTRYAHSDLYGKLIENWEKSEDVRDRWNIHVRSCYKRDYHGQPPFHTPDSLKLDFYKDSKGKYEPIWPRRFTLADLEAMRASDEYAFATQQLNDPVSIGDDSRPFPLKAMRWIDPKDFVKVPMSHFSVTVDTADTVGLRANNSCITVCGWDKFGRCYVVDVRLGKMMPDALIETICAVQKKYRPTMVMIEETSFVRGLKPSIKRKMDIDGLFIPLTFIKRETHISKQERILNTVQPWYKAGEIIFLENLHDKDHIIRELDRFPTWQDDFLDTLADQFQNREWFGRTSARPMTREAAEFAAKQQMEEGMARYLRIADPDLEGEWSVPDPTGGGYYDRTGGL